MKKNGLNPMANAAPPTYISSFGVVLDKYVPPEGDGKSFNAIKKLKGFGYHFPKHV